MEPFQSVILIKVRKSEIPVQLLGKGDSKKDTEDIQSL